METLFGTTGDVNAAQGCARAVVVFFYGLILLRISGRRTFAGMSALDTIIIIVAGSVLARAVTGSAPMDTAMAGAGMLVFLHWLVARLLARSEMLAHLVEGSAITIAQNGTVDDKARKSSKIAKSDIAEALREHGLDGMEELNKTLKLTLERSGRISVIKQER
jgi:uncharacterized membrane protein YcaP (DUF421 family)